MEDESLEIPAAGTRKGSGAGRWNPTKEQISMLESLYMQGIRTPSAEQIHEITMRLKEYGHIEGKNVFYWFQNHKARQRQKQKQDHVKFHYYNGYLHLNKQDSLVFHPNPNVAFNPYYIIPQQQLVFDPNNQNPSGINKRTRSQKGNLLKEAPGVESSVTPQETLDLFPLHPTGILEERCSKSSSSISSTVTTSLISPWGLYDIDEKEQTFFDFF